VECPRPDRGSPTQSSTRSSVALDTTEDLLLEHRYIRTLRKEQGPLELHEAAYLFTMADAVPLGPPGTPRPKRPCVDARTGEDLTPFGATWSVHAVNGRVTSRSVTRARSSP
jgi:hypothetical protein